VQAERVVEHKKVLDVVADRLRIVGAERVRVVEAIELALKRGGGRVNVYVLRDDASWRAVGSERRERKFVGERLL
jgi:excinuclease ABC subunit A